MTHASAKWRFVSALPITAALLACGSSSSGNAGGAVAAAGAAGAGAGAGVGGGMPGAGAGGSGVGGVGGAPSGPAFVVHLHDTSFFADGVTMTSYTAAAMFFGGPGPGTATCTQTVDGACTMTKCTSTGGAGGSGGAAGTSGAAKAPDAGDITITGGTDVVLLKADPTTGAYPGAFGAKSLFNAGDTLSCSSTGADVPAFASSRMHPRLPPRRPHFPQRDHPRHLMALRRSQRRICPPSPTHRLRRSRQRRPSPSPRRGQDHSA